MFPRAATLSLRRMLQCNWTGLGTAWISRVTWIRSGSKLHCNPWSGNLPGTNAAKKWNHASTAPLIPLWSVQKFQDTSSDCSTIKSKDREFQASLQRQATGQGQRRISPMEKGLGKHALNENHLWISWVSWAKMATEITFGSAEFLAAKMLPHSKESKTNVQPKDRLNVFVWKSCLSKQLTSSNQRVKYAP